MDKIDPGPGYRLLEPWELVQNGDDVESWPGDGLHWKPSLVPAGALQVRGLRYRRMIEAPKDTEIHGTIVAAESGEQGANTMFLHWVADRLVHVHKNPEGVDFVRRLRVLADSLPEIPKPFTPNKYTRYIPTLDGRTAPVDVYCVSEAFSLGTCLQSGGALDAVNHARKKLLAPGQRGTKSAIQDIKEAHASLGRAIALEEAALGREVHG